MRWLRVLIGYKQGEARYKGRELALEEGLNGMHGTLGLCSENARQKMVTVMGKGQARAKLERAYLTIRS